MSLVERKDVSRSLVAGHLIRSIAAALGRAPSSISQEIHRNGGSQQYRAMPTKPLGTGSTDRRLVSWRVIRSWRNVWLMRTFPGDMTSQVSHETIYRRLFI